MKEVSDLSTVLKLKPDDIIFSNVTRLVVFDIEIVTIEIEELGKLVIKISN